LVFVYVLTILRPALYKPSRLGRWFSRRFMTGKLKDVGEASCIPISAKKAMFFLAIGSSPSTDERPDALRRRTLDLQGQR
jgi:hypothetical protein